MPMIESLEERMIDLMKCRFERLAQRRRQDVEDHLQEVKAANNILTGGQMSIPPPSANDQRTRRAAEREGRRTRRRRQRELKNIKAHKDGLSSDEEETEFEINNFKKQRGKRNRRRNLNLSFKYNAYY